MFVFMHRKWFRRFAGILCAALLIVACLPGVYSMNSGEGVVNARTLTLRSPMAGTVRYSGNLRHGQFFRAGEVLGTVYGVSPETGFPYDCATAENPGTDSAFSREKGPVRQYRIRAPFDCLVWRIPAGNMSGTDVGSDLLVLMDCGSVFLDASVPESVFLQAPPGSRMEYRFPDEKNFHSGIVVARRSPETGDRPYELADVPVRDSGKTYRLWIEVSPDGLGGTPENFLRVGRRVEVRLPKKNSGL